MEREPGLTGILPDEEPEEGVLPEPEDAPDVDDEIVFDDDDPALDSEV